MTNLRKLGTSVCLTLVFGVSALADCAPGILSTPPCVAVAAQMTPDDGVAPGEVSSPPASNAGSGYSVTELALGALESLLSIF
jgi:hypothetical protein